MAGGFTQSTRIPVPANGTSAVIFAPVLSWVTVDPAPGVNVTVEWTRDTLASINANTAVWDDWNLGVISNSSVNKRDTPELNCYVRAVTTVSNPSNSTVCTLEVLANPGALIPELTPQWQSQGNTGGGGGTVAVWWKTPSFNTIESIQEAVDYCAAHGWMPIVLTADARYVMGATGQAVIKPPAGRTFRMLCFGTCNFDTKDRTDPNIPCIYMEQDSSGGLTSSEFSGINFQSSDGSDNQNAYAIKIAGSVGTTIGECAFQGIFRGVCASNSVGGGGGPYYTEQLYIKHCHFHSLCSQMIVLERGFGPRSFHGFSITGGTVMNLNSKYPGVQIIGLPTGLGTFFTGAHVYSGRLDVEIFNKDSLGPCVFIDTDTATVGVQPQDFAGGTIHIEGGTARIVTMSGLKDNAQTVNFIGGSIYTDHDNIVRMGTMRLSDYGSARPDGSSALISRVQKGVQTLTTGTNVLGFGQVRLDALSQVYIRLTSQHTYISGALTAPYENRYLLTQGRFPYSSATLPAQIEAILYESDPTFVYNFDSTKVDAGLDTITITTGGITIVPGYVMRLSTPGGAPDGLVDGTSYYVIWLSTTGGATPVVTIQLALTLSDAMSNPPVPVAIGPGVGAGAMTLTQAPFGNIGNGGIEFTMSDQGQLNIVAPYYPQFSILCEWEVHTMGQTGSSVTNQSYNSLLNTYDWFSNSSWVDTTNSIISCYWPHDTAINGLLVTFVVSGTPPTGLPAGDYYIRGELPNGLGLSFYTTQLDAVNGTNKIPITGAGAGTFTFVATRG